MCKATFTAHLLNNLEVVLLQCSVANAGGAAGEQLVALSRLGQCNYVTQGGGVAQEGHQSEKDVSRDVRAL